MATYRPKIGYSAWSVPATPTKYKLDWFKIGVLSGVLTFCLSVWVYVIILAARVL